MILLPHFRLIVSKVCQTFRKPLQGSDIQPTRYPTQVSWKGCRRLEDGNMEIEVDVDSVRHVPSYPIKFTKNKIDHQVKSIKDLGIIQDCEMTSVANQFTEHWQTSVEKMGRQKEPEVPKTVEVPPKEDEKNELKEPQKPKEEPSIAQAEEPVVAQPPTNRFTIQPVKETEPEVEKAAPPPTNNGRFLIQQVKKAAPPVEPEVKKAEPVRVDIVTQTGDEGGGSSSLDKVRSPEIYPTIDF